MYGDPFAETYPPPVRHRLNYGLRLWQFGFDGCVPYCYQHNPVNMPWDKGYYYAYPTMDRPIPTLQWEAFREGVDDVRYLTTMLETIDKAAREGRHARLRQQVGEWLRTLDLSQDLQAIRRKMAKHIVDLRS